MLSNVNDNYPPKIAFVANVENAFYNREGILYLLRCVKVDFNEIIYVAEYVFNKSSERELEDLYEVSKLLQLKNENLVVMLINEAMFDRPYYLVSQTGYNKPVIRMR